VPWLCRQSDPVSCLCVHWQVRSTYFPMDTQAANWIWLPTQPRHYTTREKIPLSHQLLKMGTRWPETCWATYKEKLIRRNKYNTKWHLVGFLFHIELRCTVNHTSNLGYTSSYWGLDEDRCLLDLLVWTCCYLSEVLGHTQLSPERGSFNYPSRWDHKRIRKVFTWPSNRDHTGR